MTLVYRLETLLGEGIYCAWHGPSIHPNGYDDDRHPAPYYNFPQNDWAKSPDASSFVFGFQSLEALGRWFGPEERKTIKETNEMIENEGGVHRVMHLHSYQVPDSDVRHGFDRRQLIFHRQWHKPLYRAPVEVDFDTLKLIF